MAKKNIEKIEYRVPCKIPEFGDYSDNTKLSENLEIQISKRIKQLRRKGEDLAVHSQYLESIVDEQISKCLRDLDTQHLIRINYINKAFLKRNADKENFQHFLLLIESELASVEEEFKTIEILYKQFNPIYDGKLKTNTCNNNEEEMADE